MRPECPQAIHDHLGDGEWTPYSRPPARPEPAEAPGPEPDAEGAPGRVAAADPDATGGETAGADRARVDHVGGGHAWLVGEQIVRRHPSSTPAVAEAERTAWLTAALAGPAASAGDGLTDDDGGRSVGDDERRAAASRWGLRAGPAALVIDGAWSLTPRPDGAPAHRPDLHPRPDSLPATIGTALARLHALDVDACPTARSTAEVVDEVRNAITADRLVVDLLPAPYDRYPAERLLAMIDEAPLRPADPVVAHGAPLLANLWPTPGGDGATVIGLHHLGVAERTADLAVIHRQLQDGFGPEAVFAFYEAYGQHPDLVALDHQLLIDAVRSAIIP
ncbi:MAG: phosphotransferase [Actinomycetota bacterium]